MSDNPHLEEYLNSLSNKNDIFSGIPDLLPEPILRTYGKYESALEEYNIHKQSGMTHPDDLADMKHAIKDLKVQFEKAMQKHFPSFFPSPIHKQPENMNQTSENSIHKNSSETNDKKQDLLSLNEKYIQSLKEKDNIYTGNKSLLRGFLRELYRQNVAAEKEYSRLYDAGFKGMDEGEKMAARQKFDSAKSRFYEAMDDFAQKISSQKLKQEEKNTPRAPQITTVNGDKISHGHIFQHEKTEDWMFAYRINGKNMPVIRLSAEDAAKFQNTVADHDTSAAVKEVLEKYNPSKLLPKVPTTEWVASNILSDGRKLDKFTIYKETNEERAGYGKWKFYAQVGDIKMSRLADFESRNAFFDRTQTPAQLAEKLFGERLNLASAYAQYTLPAGVNNIRIGKGNDQKWQISAEVDGIRTPKRELSYDDRTSYFKTKTATADQLAAKYLINDINAMREQSVKTDRSMKV